MASSNKFNHIIMILMTIAIYLENIMVARVMGAPLKPTHFIFIAATVFALVKRNFKIERRQFRWLFLLLLLPGFPLYRIHNVVEWMKSYVIWIIILCYMEIGFPFWYEKFQTSRKQYIKIFLYVMMGVQLLAIIQSVLMNLTGIMFLANAFGPFQFIESYVSARNGLYRAFSIFHEPSVLGWVNTTGLAVALYTKREKILKRNVFNIFIGLCFLTMIVSFSASGMYFFFIILLFYLMMTYKKKKSFAILFALCCLIPVLWNCTDILSPMKRVFMEYNTVNSSGYERLNAPLQYAKKTLHYYPLFGRGIGQEGMIDAVGVIATADASVANNSLYQVIMNFGTVAVFVIYYYFKYFVKNIRQDLLYFLCLINIIGVFVGTGAYISLDYLVVSNVLLLIKYDYGNK